MPPVVRGKKALPLRPYQERLRRSLTQFPCPQCGEILLPKNYETHCSTHHNLNSKTHCVWCQGRVSWTSKTKKDHADHLSECYRAFLTSQLSIPAAEQCVLPASTFTLFDKRPMCPPKRFFDHEKLSSYPPRAFEPIWPLPLDPSLLTFQEDSHLDLAVSCIRKYLDLEGEESSAEWFHVMVRAVAFTSFASAMDADGGRTRTLPFSCWCDGGAYPEARHRQHRHMIVVSSPKGHFIKNVWKKVKIPDADRPCKNFPCIRSKRIESPMHLVNALGYLSQRESKCNFSFNEPSSDGRENLNHFWIFQPLPALYRIVLTTQWDGGLSQLVRQNFQHVHPDRLVRHAKMVDSQWRIKIRDLPGIKLDLVLPVTRDLRPCTQLETDCFVHLVHGRKLHFERVALPDRQNQEEWAAMQARAGNSFYGVAGEEFWTLPPHQQKYLNAVKPSFDANRQLQTRVQTLEGSNGQLGAQISDLEGSNRQLLAQISDLEGSNGQLRAQISNLEQSNGQLETRLQTLRESNEPLQTRVRNLEERLDAVTRERDSLLDQRGSLKTQLRTLNERWLASERENKSLLKRIDAIQEKRVADLEKRIADLEARNGRLEARNAHLETRNAAQDERIAELEAQNVELGAQNALQAMFIIQLVNRETQTEKPA